MISCIASDPANRSHYRQAPDMDDGVKSDRFLLDTEQMQDFGRWEKQKQTEGPYARCGNLPKGIDAGQGAIQTRQQQSSIFA